MGKFSGFFLLAIAIGILIGFLPTGEYRIVCFALFFVGGVICFVIDDAAGVIASTIRTHRK